MNEETIKILEELKNKKYKVDKIEGWEHYLLSNKEQVAIENIIKEYKEKDKDNNDLRRLYRKTAIKLKENGKEDLADFFLAQINEVPTFTVDDDIDYYTEYYKLKENIREVLNIIKEEHDKAIKGFINGKIPQCVEDGGIAQELGYFIGKIEELLEKRK